MMTKKLKTTVLAMALLLGAVVAFGTTGQAMASDREDIKAAIEKYSAAFNDRNLEGIKSAYTANGVLMPQNASAVFGPEKISALYANFFEQISMNGKLEPQEIVLMSDDWAFVRTTSITKMTLKANGTELPDALSQELFILHKDNGWKIARYMFSSTVPPQRPE